MDKDTAPTLTATKRERTGSRYAKRLRDAGKLPAVVYGHKEDPVSIQLDMHETILQLSRGEKFFQLDLEGATEYVLLKDLGYGYLGDDIIHADFARVSLDERVDVRVSIHYVGEAKGLKTAGAIMMHPTTDLELNCLITNLPDEVEVDVSDMEVGDVIHAGEVKLPLETMQLLTDPDTVVAQIVLKAEQPEEDEAGEVDAAAGASPEVIGEKKDGEDTEAKPEE
jgi:large subunit ribosomal protein L25